MERERITYSFIIPHHNTPDLLQRLIDTIPQRDDIEIIVVDDNSDVNKKAKTIRSDVKTIFLSKEQSRGAGKARNVGIDAAVGKWLLFADSDDFYLPNFVQVLDEYKYNDIDILFFNVSSVDSDTLEPILRHDRGDYQRKLVEQYDGSEETTNNLLFWGFGPWRKMLNAQYVREYGFRFEEIPIANDSFFCFQTSFFSRKWKLDKRQLYVLTHRSGSLTYSKVTRQKYTTIINVYCRRAKLFKYMGHPEWNRKSIMGLYSQSPFKYIYTLLKRGDMAGFEALWYYLTNWRVINKQSNYYVDFFKKLQEKNS